MAKSKKPVSSSGTSTPPKTQTASAKPDAKTSSAKKTSTSTPASASTADKTAKSAASKAGQAAKPVTAPEPKRVDAVKETPKPAASTSDAKVAEKKSAEKPVEKPKSTPPEPKKVETVENKVEAPTPRPAPTPAPQKSGSVVPMVLGGVFTAGLGFAASEANFMGWRTQDDSLRVAVEAQDSKITEQAEALAALQTSVAAPDLSAFEASLAELSDQVSALDERVAEVEARPAGTVANDGGAPVDDVRAELTEMQAALAAQRAEIEGLLGTAKTIEEATAASARAAAGQQALAQVTAAISNGGGYSAAIDAMTQAGITDLPAALTDPAADGVATLINLQTRFPDLARDALADARASETETEETGVGGFLRRQLGARSVVPREGDSPDAVLSRAEAAVRDGRVADALREIDALPQGAKDAMQSWSADAKMRADAEAAVRDLSQRLTAN